MKRILIFIIAYIILSTSTTFIYANSLNFLEYEKEIQKVSGVTHVRSNGTITNDKGVKSNQNINVFELSEGVEVATWSVFKNGKYSRESILNIAKDFELNNPSYEVIAGVNGDYFDNETINANVIFGNKVIKPNNHQKYQAMELNNFGYKIKSHENTYTNPELSLRLYDENNSLIHHEYIKNSNTFVTSKGQTSISLNPVELNLKPLNKYFELRNYSIHNDGSHVYIQGEIGKEIFEINHNNPIIITSNEETINKLYNNPTFNVQKDMRDFKENHILFGYDGIILENNQVKKFDEMKGQSTSNNTSRHPRTGFGFNFKGELTLFTIDGRDAGGSKGVDLREFGKIMNYYGVIEGYNLDGGGSTQAIFRENNELKYVNEISQTPARLVGNAILFIKNKSENYPDILINDKINIIFNDNTSDVEQIVVKLDGKEFKYYLNENIVLDIPNKESVALSVLVVKNIHDKSARVLIRNELIVTNFEEKVIYPEIYTEHKYLNNELKITVTYDDPQRIINTIRVYLKYPNIDKPALPINSSARTATFKDVEKLEEQEVIVIVSFKDGGTYRETYRIVKKDKVETLIRPIVSVIFFLTNIGLFIKLCINRKRLHLMLDYTRLIVYNYVV